MKNDIIIFAFDFSMSKPAMCYYYNNKLHFWCFPMKVDEKTLDILRASNINVINRNLPSIDKKTYDSHSLVKEHINRANNLANIIISTIKDIITRNNIDVNNVIIASEGLSFASKGDAMLDLSGYKYVLLSKFIEMGIDKIYTYSPITIKSVAGCSKKNNLGKLPMIEKIKEENPNNHFFISNLKFYPEQLKKKTSFVQCVDDLVDAYWCLKTVIDKEKLNIEL